MGDLTAAVPRRVKDPAAGSLAPEVKRSSPLASLRFWAIVLGVIVLASSFWVGTGYAYAPFSASRFVPEGAIPSDPAALSRFVAKLKGQNRQAEAALDRLAPRGTYIVIDQTQNRLYIKSDGKVEREAVCSSGSGIILKESAEGGRKWVFDTPRGLFKVRQKNENPAWKKPDWAFIEEGEPIPRNPADRIMYGELGEYALYFGNGYMIHGTLYERLLGRSVSHGCIRLGKEDLRALWKAAPVGTPIYIY